MKTIQVKLGKPSKFYVNNKKISLNTAFGMYQNGAKFNLKFGTHLSIDDIIRERIKLSTIKDIINNPTKYNLNDKDIEFANKLQAAQTLFLSLIHI